MSSNGSIVQLAGGFASVAPEGDGIHLTVGRKKHPDHVIGLTLSSLEAREVAKALVTLADEFDAPAPKAKG
jgi:hypothetical protein